MVLPAFTRGKAPAIVRWASVALLALTIPLVLAASAAPPSSLSAVPDTVLGIPADLVGHFLMYAALGAELTLVLAAFGMVRRYPIGAAGLAICACAGYGFLMEVYQRFVPGRDASWADVAANSLGAAVGVLAVTAAAVLIRWGALSMTPGKLGE
ncbi:MAG: VanZ family protein [Dehalococcoidia bacterium]